MTRVIAVLGSTLLLAAAGSTVVGHAASNSEQVTFSSSGGTGHFGGVDSKFAFWIWCETDSNNPYFGQCNGSVQFQKLGIATHVNETSIPGFTEPQDGQYRISVTSSTGNVSCTLINELPRTSGPHNTIDVSCSAPSGSGSVSNGVVNVTGPPS